VGVGSIVWIGVGVGSLFIVSPPKNFTAPNAIRPKINKRIIKNKSFFPRRDELEDELDEDVVSELKGDCEKTDSSMDKVEYSITLKKSKNDNSLHKTMFSVQYTDSWRKQ
jgi:hypothetical protein